MPASLVQLEFNAARGKAWQPLARGMLRGHAFRKDQLLSSTDWEQLLDKVDTAADLGRLLQSLNGHFSLVWQGANQVLAAVDIGRTLPLFWKVHNGRLLLCSHLGPEQLEPTRWHASRALGQAEFIPGHHTLSHGWQQLQAGECLEFRQGMVYLHTYFEHRRPAPSSASREELAARFSALIEQLTQRWITYANGRTIVIPLSGGYDSRLLLAALHRAGYPHLKTFTYGQPGSPEVQLAQAITAQLQVDWRFVEYTPALLQRFFSSEFEQYADYAGNLCATPQEQDFFALWALQEVSYLPPDSILCPGYCGDFQAGSYALPDRLRKLSWRRKERLQDYLFQRFNPQPTAELRQFWQMHLPQSDIEDAEQALSEMEHWILREYVPKYVLNGVRAFEYRNYDWYLPLWDQAFISFWQTVPQRYRQGMELYRQTLETELFRPLDISFPADFVREEMSVFGHWLPLRWKKRIKALLPTKREYNINGLHGLSPAIQAQLGLDPPDDSLTVNQLVGRWYHEHLDQARK